MRLYFLQKRLDLHDLARITDDLVLFKKSMVHFQAAGAANLNYYSVYLSWGHALADLTRRTGAAKSYKAAFEKYRRAAEIEPTDTAAHHSWYYAMLEFARIRCGGFRMARWAGGSRILRARSKR